MDKGTLRVMVADAGILRGAFVLRSGQVSDFYFDKWEVLCRPMLLRAVAEQMAPLTHPDATILAAPELGAVPLVTALSLRLRCPFVVVRAGRKIHGTANAIEGPLMAGMTATPIEDVLTTGGAAVEAVAALREVGVVVRRVVALCDREQGAREHLSELGIDVKALFTLRQLLEVHGGE